MNKKQYDMVMADCDAVLKQGYHGLINLKNNTILITGGTGFVGTWLLDLLCYLNEHYQFNTSIFVLARNVERFKKHNARFAHKSYIQFIGQDLRYATDLPTDINWVIHAAGVPDNRFHASNPLETMSIIADGTRVLLKNLERVADLKMCLNISSGLIYGPQPGHMNKISESYIGAPKSGTVSSAYAEAKRYAETLCSSARSQSKIPVVIARPFAFVGPSQSLEGPWAVNNFIHDAIKGNPIRILGDGKTMRSYLYASDMAFWLLKILVSAESGDVYNVGSEQAISLQQLAFLIAKQFGSSVDIKLNGFPVDNAAHFIPDVSSAEKQLGLTQTVDLERAIQRTIAWNQYE